MMISALSFVTNLIAMRIELSLTTVGNWNSSSCLFLALAVCIHVWRRFNLAIVQIAIFWRRFNLANDEFCKIWRGFNLANVRFH